MHCFGGAHPPREGKGPPEGLPPSADQEIPVGLVKGQGWEGEGSGATVLRRGCKTPLTHLGP